MARIAVNGADLYYEDTGGAGAPIVFSHGLFWSGRMFEAQIAALAGRYRCVSYDHRGQGKSAVARTGYDLETVAEDGAALIRALKLGPCHFVGLSMGGFVGMRLAARKPELLRSLSLLNTAADGEPGINKPKYAALGAVARLFGLRLVEGEVMKAMFGRTFLADPARKERREELRAQLRGLDLTGGLRALGGVTHRAPIETELPAIGCPTLMIIGDEDRAVVPTRGERTARLIPGCTIVRIPRAGHSSCMENPEAVTAALRSFLDGVDSRAGQS